MEQTSHTGVIEGKENYKLEELVEETIAKRWKGAAGGNQARMDVGS